MLVKRLVQNAESGARRTVLGSLFSESHSSSNAVLPALDGATKSAVSNANHKATRHTSYLEPGYNKGFRGLYHGPPPQTR